MKVWYPTSRVQLVLRVDKLDELKSFDDNPTSDTESASAGTPTSTSDRDSALQRHRETRDELISRKGSMAPDVFAKNIASSDREFSEIYKAASASSEEGLTSDPNVIKLWVLPKRVSVEKNNLSDCDKCTIELDYRSLPFDPRSFRAAAVRVIIGSVSSEDYDKGVNGGGSQLDLPSIVPPETSRWYSATGNTRFVGFVDEWMVDFDDSGETVSLQCRDLSSVVRDTPVRFGTGIDLDKGIRAGVDEFISQYKSMKEIKVVYGNPIYPINDGTQKLTDLLSRIDGPIPRGSAESLPADLNLVERELQQEISKNGLDIKVTTETENPTTGEVESVEQPTLLPRIDSGLYDEDIVKQASKAGSKKKESKKKGVAKNKTDQTVKVWEHIVEILSKMGLFPIMKGNLLFIASPRDIFSGVFGRRQMVWGGNISKLKMARKSGSSDSVGKGVQILSVNPRSGRTQWARFPVLPGEPSAGVLGVQGSPQPVNTRGAQAVGTTKPVDSFINYNISGVSSPKRLLTIAEAVFNRVARQEVEVAIETDSLSSFGTSRKSEGLEETDLLGIESGDSIIVETIRTAASTEASNLLPGSSYLPNNFLDISAMSYGERQDFMQGIGFSPTVAKELAGSQEMGDVQRTFRVNHASISWDVSSGVKISIDAINYIEAGLRKFQGENVKTIGSSVTDRALTNLDKLGI